MSIHLLLVVPLLMSDAHAMTSGKYHKDAASVQLASVLYAHGETQGLLELVLAKTRLEEPHRGYKYVFQLVNVLPLEEGRQARNRELLVEFPDIPTHDRMGAPNPVRAGALAVDTQTQRIFVVVSKSIGRRLIMRVYEIPRDESTGAIAAHKVSPRAIAQIEDHGSETDAPVQTLIARTISHSILITANPSDGDTRARKFSLDLRTKSFSKMGTER